MGTDAEQLVELIDRTAAEVARRPLAWDELDQLRYASRRLRRTIEIRTISTSVLCRACSEMFVAPTGAATSCPNCTDAEAARPSSTVPTHGSEE